MSRTVPAQRKNKPTQKIVVNVNQNITSLGSHDDTWKNTQMHRVTVYLGNYKQIN